MARYFQLPEIPDSPLPPGVYAFFDNTTWQLLPGKGESDLPDQESAGWAAIMLYESRRQYILDHAEEITLDDWLGM
jgi:hypothetical protein